jgi:hypothetical protein
MENQTNQPEWWQSTLQYIVTAAADAKFRPDYLNGSGMYQLDQYGRVVPVGQPLLNGATSFRPVSNQWLMIGGIALLFWMMK